MKRTVKTTEHASSALASKLIDLWKTATEKATINFRSLNPHNDAAVSLSSKIDGKQVNFNGWCYIDLIHGYDTIVATSLVATVDGADMQLV